MLQRFHQEGRRGYDLGDLDFFVEQEILAYQSGQKTRILSEGMYMDKIPKWHKSFGGNLKLYNASAFIKPSANKTMNDICDYLGIASYNFNSILKIKYNSTGKSVQRTAAYEKLRLFYAPQVVALSEQHGINFQ